LSISNGHYTGVDYTGSVCQNIVSVSGILTQAENTAVHTLPFMSTLTLQSNKPLYSSTVIGTLVIDGWAVAFGTARRGLGGLGPRPVPPCCTKCNSQPINGQCTNFILFNLAL